MPRILIVSNDIVRRAMGGAGIRNFELARALAAAGLDVTLAAKGGTDIPSLPFRVVDHDEPLLRSLASQSDAVVGQGWVLDAYPFLRGGAAALVVDLYDPFVLEGLPAHTGAALQDRWNDHRGRARVLAEQMRDGDFFLCASERQRDYWLGALSALDRINPATYDDDPTLRRLIDVVAFGVPDDPPAQRRHALRGVVPGISDGDYVLLWGGGLWNWFDPLTLVRAVQLAAPRVPSLRLYFMAAPHPNPVVGEMDIAGRTRALASELGLIGSHVFFNDRWIDYEDRADFLLDADVGVSTHPDHVETQFAFRTRLLDCVWAGLPVICTEGDTLADMIAARGMGLTVAPESPEALADAIVSFADASRRGEAAERMRAATDEFRWSLVVEPLVRFCLQPRLAADRRVLPPPVASEAATVVAPPLRERVVERFRADGLGGVAAAVKRTAARVAQRRR
ncbi:MAG TPA: glycosyltransferase family 4 protein [Candidatus Angelobacter sp.]|jgi:glycosyltransferase involved in cell wall biosynthesis|nr:glycosyltransferase family 4 protein [Candidatus Angelobacter sp.]